MDFTVGGERISLTHEQVERAMKGTAPETFQKYVVEMHGQLYPPKQVFAKVTGRDRQSFTTLEAQRVLKRLGFVCREAGRPGDDVARLKLELAASHAAVSQAAEIESEFATIKLAIAELERRIRALEERGQAA
jgi:hypothetical protein